MPGVFAVAPAVSTSWHMPAWWHFRRRPFRASSSVEVYHGHPWGSAAAGAAAKPGGTRSLRQGPQTPAARSRKGKRDILMEAASTP